MRIVNLTKKTIIAQQTEKAESFWKKTKGLMFRKQLSKHIALLMVFDKESVQGIWMPFMRFCIDVIFLDSQKNVIKVYENIPPISKDPKTWRVYSSLVPARYIIETNKGTIRKSRTEIGDVIGFI